jgi:hypothetical protein
LGGESVATGIGGDHTHGFAGHNGDSGFFCAIYVYLDLSLSKLYAA